MNDLMNMRVGALAKSNFAFIQLFTEHNIDFYCQGEWTLRAAVEEANIDEAAFQKALQQLSATPAKNYQVAIEEWPLDLLADYIQKIHHRYTEHTMLELREMINTYLRAEQPGHNLLVGQFKTLFDQLVRELAVHMKKEEFMFFPFIRKRLSSPEGAAAVDKSLGTPIEMFTHEHQTQHELLSEIYALFEGYQIDPGEDEGLEEIVALMEALANDLALHLHLENNILFPETLRMEQENAGS